MAADGSARVKWGIIGPGGIAKAFTGGVQHSQTGELVAIGTRNPDKPGLAESFPGARIVNGYQALIDDPEVEAIYIATPHPFHAEWAIKCAEGGKHVLCEKPMGLSAWEADAMFHAARKAGTFMGEAFMYRLHPQTVRLAELVAEGAIGEVRLIKSEFGFALGNPDPKHRLLANDLGGGAILDVCGYPVSMARLIAGAAVGKPFADPVKVSGMAHLGATGADEWCSALLEFDSGIIAEVSGSVMVKQENVLRIYGTTGRIEVADFWFAGGKQGGVGTIKIVRPDESVETIEVDEPRWLYSFEVDGAGQAIRAGQTEFSLPGMSGDDTLGNLRVMDKWRADAGLVYDIETPARRTRTLKNEALSVKPNPIEKRQIPGLSKPTSLVALGSEYFPDFASAAILLDRFYECGGNLLDTGHVYGAGKGERHVGDWMASRGVRDECLVIAKGAHSPLCYPDIIGKQLARTLEGLRTDHVDVYFMHRDNPAIPVGEFVDAMDAEARAGRIKGPFGGSNWTRERYDEAVAYAKANGKIAPSALSNNFSLAELIEPMWAGCIAASDDEWKAWLNERQIPNFAWSSQGRGFFTDAAGRGKFDNEEVARCWYSEKNFERRDRAIELGQKLGRSPIHIALAYVLAQPFPMVPLIGPRRLVELEDSLSALDIKLTPEQVRWLESGG